MPDTFLDLRVEVDDEGIRLCLADDEEGAVAKALIVYVLGLLDANKIHVGVLDGVVTVLEAD